MTSIRATIARHPFDLTRAQVEGTMRGVPAEAVRAHYVIVNGRRYPPKQVIAAVTGLDRSAFITTQARQVLERLGFTVGRLGSPPIASTTPDARTAADARLEREADLLRPYRGEFVAVDAEWSEVIASGPDPGSVRRAIAAIGRTGVIFQVPSDPGLDVGGFAW